MTVTLDDKSLPTRGFFQRNGIIRADQTLQILNASHFAYDKSINIGFSYFWMGGVGFVDGGGSGDDQNDQSSTDLRHLSGLYIPTRAKGDGEHLVGLHVFGDAGVEVEATFDKTSATLSVTSGSDTRWTRASASIDFSGELADIVSFIITSPGKTEECLGIVVSDLWLGTSNIP